MTKNESRKRADDLRSASTITAGMLVYTSAQRDGQFEALDWRVVESKSTVCEGVIRFGFADGSRAYVSWNAVLNTRV